MTKKIALLRGINVGGKRKVLMADLRQLLEGNGFTDVKTYIQSGNVIFTLKEELDNLEIAKKIETVISDNYEFDVPVVVRTAEEWERAIKDSPFYEADMEDISQLHLTFLKEKPTDENQEKTETYDYPPDKFIIKNTEIYILCLGKYHKTKLSNTFFEKKLKVSTTTRNWKTVLKLLELSR
ncbi:MAG: hypothetical protein ACI85O_001892 [Saprospiraceae bacterium]|jgi:uncharacterized protein (DUF1697 family)